MLKSIGELIVGIVSAGWSVVSTILNFVWDLLLWLHLDAPRLEGLLVGILLAWILTRRDSHPILKMLSAPLKLAIDILDLAWDQAIEFLDDGWETISGVAASGWSWVKLKLSNGYNSVMNRLRKTKEDLK